MVVDFMFKGLMVPVFTPFLDDKKLTVNYDVIDKYAHYLKTMGMQGVMVNGLTGEGMTLLLDERKKLTEKWMEVTRKYDLKMLVNIGGMNLAEVYELAEHAEKLKVDAVMVMPDLFYKPNNEEDLVLYLKDIMVRMPTRPLFYYHIPMMTNVYLDMFNFIKLMQKEVPTFTGLFWADDKIDKVVFLKEKLPEYLYIIAIGTSIMGFMVEGFDAFSLTALNLVPEMIKELYDNMLNQNLNQALIVKQKFIKNIYDLLQLNVGFDWMTVMKLQMEKINPIIKMGPVRKPKVSINNMMMWTNKM